MAQGVKTSRDRIRELHGRGYTDPMIGDVLGVRDETVCRIRRCELGLKAIGFHNPYSRQERTLSIRRAMKKRHGVGAVWEISELAQRIKAARMGWPGLRPSQALILSVLEHGPVRSAKLLAQLCLAKKKNDPVFNYGFFDTFGTAHLYQLMVELKREGLVEAYNSPFNRGQGKTGRVCVYQLTNKALEIGATRSKVRAG